MSQNSNRLEELIKEHQNALYRAALSVTGNPQDAEDAVQDGYLKYLERRPRVPDGRSARAWLMRVTLNAALDRLRDKKRHPTEELLDVHPAPDPGTGELLAAIGELPPAERAAVHLFYYEGYQTGEIAKILGRRPGTVRSDLSRARERLREKLKGEIEL